MKTFDTEKHNIPEGATHYREAQAIAAFIWVKVSGKVAYVWGFNQWEVIHFDVEGLDIKPIPQTKEVEWVNGDECVIRGERLFYVGESSEEGVHVVEEIGGGVLRHAHVSVISKPETEAERVEREMEKKKAIDVNAMCFAVTSLKPSQAVALYDLGYSKRS